MKITATQLRKIIKEEVNRVLAESVDQSVPSVRSYLRQMVSLTSRLRQLSTVHPTMHFDPAKDLNMLGGVWDDMVKIVKTKPDFDAAAEAKDLDMGARVGWQMLSFHLRKLKADMEAGRQIPTGSELAAAALAEYKRKEASAAAPKPAYDPGAAEREWNAAHPYRGYMSDD